MKILFLSPDLPYPQDNGGRIRSFSLMRELARRHEVHLLAFDRRPELGERVSRLEEVLHTVVAVPLDSSQTRGSKRREQLRSLFRASPYQRTAFYSKSMQSELDRLVDATRYDVVQVEFSQMGYYRLPAGVPAVLDLHNVEYELLHRTYLASSPSLRKLYSYFEWKKFRRDEERICRRVPVCVTTSRRDRQLLEPEAPGTRFHVVPNGVDCSHFRYADDAPDDGADLVFTGTISYHPNTDGVQYFAAEILPRIHEMNADARLWIVGHDPPSRIRALGKDARIRVTGSVDDTRTYLRRAAAVVVPLRIGGGTRLKILEAMAMGRAVVSTRIGAEGIDAVHGEHLLLADLPGEFAAAVCRLLEDPGLRRRLARAGRQLVERLYDWPAIAHRLETVHRSQIG